MRKRLPAKSSTLSRHTQRRKAAVWLSFLFIFIGPIAAFAQIEVNVTHIGYPTVREGDVIRCGDWAPVVVDVALGNQPSFDGVVRIGERDIDGDKYYDEVELHLRSETGGSRRVNLLIPTNPTSGNAAYEVELFDDDGVAVEVVSNGALTRAAKPDQQPTVIGDDAYFVLSTSSGTISRVKELADSAQLRLPYTRRVFVAHIAISELPERWIGLEMVDAIVWDETNPDDLNQRQLTALSEWVRHGGTLLMAASRTASSLHQTRETDQMLPVNIGDIFTVNNLHSIRDDLIGPPPTQDDTRVASDWLDKGFPKPVPLVSCTLRQDAVAVGIEDVDLEHTVILASRLFGHGRVIYSAITMRDLFSAEGDAGRFFGDLFHLSVRNNEEDPPYQETSIFKQVAGAVSFNTRASLYLLLAGIASVAYVLVATFGSWTFLNLRGWRKQSWTMFALVAVVASLLSIAGVNTMRGWGESLHQLSIVDGFAGSRSGQATVLFGLRSSVDKHLDVWLPADRNSAVEPHDTNCTLKPLPGAATSMSPRTSFSDPQSYRILPSNAVVENVRLRGTLKQFEGRWDGALDGTIDANVVVEGLRILSQSYIANNLGVDLTDCLLLQAGREIEQNAYSRGGLIFALELGKIDNGQKIPLADRAYGVLIENDNISPLINQAGLDKAQKDWVDTLSVFTAFNLSSTKSRYVRGEEKTALLLYSTIEEFDPTTIASTAVFGRGNQRATLSRDRLRQLDLREWLVAGHPATTDEPARLGSMVLIGFSNEPGPARLFTSEADGKFRMVEPDLGQSLTMYRFRIPVKHRERPTRTENTKPVATEDQADG